MAKHKSAERFSGGAEDIEMLGGKGTTVSHLTSEEMEENEEHNAGLATVQKLLSVPDDGESA